MSDWVKVMLWEIKRNLTNKTFLISMLITPIIFLAFSAIPNLLLHLETTRVQTVYIIDGMDIYDEISPLLPENISLVEFDGAIEDLNAILLEEPDSSAIVIDEQLVNTRVIPIQTAQEGIPELRELQAAFNTALRNRQFIELGIDDAKAQQIEAGFHFPIVQIREEAADIMSRVVPAAFAGLILFSISMTGMMTFQSAIQEKKDKMAELLMSSTSPFALMQGKVAGYFVIGLLQALVWLVFAVPIAIYQFDVPVFQFLFVPILPVMLFFTITGYLMFSALFASMGATIEDVQEAGNFQGMTMMLPWMPFFFISSIISNPNGIIALVTSYFPLTSPGVMTIRLAMLGRIPIFDVIISGVLLLLFTWLVIKLSGKIFKTGMLMYGKNASIGEIVKWIRH